MKLVIKAGLMALFAYGCIFSIIGWVWYWVSVEKTFFSLTMMFFPFVFVLWARAYHELIKELENDES